MAGRSSLDRWARQAQADASQSPMGRFFSIVEGLESYGTEMFAGKSPLAEVSVNALFPWVACCNSETLPSCKETDSDAGTWSAYTEEDEIIGRDVQIAGTPPAAVNALHYKTPPFTEADKHLQPMKERGTMMSASEDSQASTTDTASSIADLDELQDNYHTRHATSTSVQQEPSPRTAEGCDYASLHRQAKVTRNDRTLDKDNDALPHERSRVTRSDRDQISHTSHSVRSKPVQHGYQRKPLGGAKHVGSSEILHDAGIPGISMAMAVADSPSAGFKAEPALRPRESRPQSARHPTRVARTAHTSHDGSKEPRQAVPPVVAYGSPASAGSGETSAAAASRLMANASYTGELHDDLFSAALAAAGDVNSDEE